jgi:general stress protein 26
MSPTPLDYEELKQQVHQRLNKNRYGVLATAEGDFVTARQMMLICNGLTITFITPNTTRKYKQILANPNVAVAIGNMQIEGVASIRGSTSDNDNAWFLKTFEEMEPDVYEGHRDECLDPETPWRVIEIAPKRIALFVSPDNYLDVLDVGKKTATRYLGKELVAPNY